MVENWNAEKMGPLDPARIVEEVVLGEVKRGVYVFPKNANLEFVEYDDTGLMERTREHSGAGILANQGLAAKREAIMSGQTEAATSRRSMAMEGPAVLTIAGAVLDLIADALQKGGGVPQSEGGASAAGERDVESQGDLHDEEVGQGVSDNDSAADAPLVHERLRGHFQHRAAAVAGSKGPPLSKCPSIGQAPKVKRAGKPPSQGAASPSPLPLFSELHTKSCTARIQVQTSARRKPDREAHCTGTHHQARTSMMVPIARMHGFPSMRPLT